MNTARLEKWFLFSYHPLKDDEPIESLYQFFVLPTTSSAPALCGVTFNDSRANQKISGFIDSHRLLTGDLLTFTPMMAETWRTIYELGTINPVYDTWLKSQGYVLTEDKIRYSMTPDMEKTIEFLKNGGIEEENIYQPMIGIEFFLWNKEKKEGSE